MYIMLRSKILKIKYLNKSATNASFNAKINEAKGEILNITNLANTTAVTAVKKKISSVSI